MDCEGRAERLDMAADDDAVGICGDRARIADAAGEIRHRKTGYAE
jgi:hypothetical protein